VAHSKGSLDLQETGARGVSVPPVNLTRLLDQIQYPGMTYVESEITRAWLKTHGAEYESIDFNVRLGEGVQLAGEWDDSTRRAATMLSQKRADIVALRAGVVTIVEVKVRIGLPALGQLIGYRELWRREHPDAGFIRLLAIGRGAVEDVDLVFRSQGVEIETFPRE
jgi:hypothetical protein